MKTFEDDDSILIGLDHRLKSKDSLTRKIIFDHNHAGISLADAKARINDSVRYTMIIDEGNYTEKAMATLKALQEKGYTVTKASNTWNNAIYKGLNTSLKSPDGTVFELQFHTTDSFITKECDNHLYYEIKRNEYTTKSEKDTATEIQKINTAQLTIPAGISGLDFMSDLEKVKKASDLTENYPHLQAEIKDIKDNGDSTYSVKK